MPAIAFIIFSLKIKLCMLVYRRYITDIKTIHTSVIMNTYFKTMADRLLQKKTPEMTNKKRRISDDDTSELFALMDNIPNAKSVAAVYQQMMRTGTLAKNFSKGDPGRRWLEVEQLILDREDRRKENRRRILWMLIVFVVIGITSYFGGIYLLAKGKNRSVQIAR